MSDYAVKFIGHIVENKRPDGFPREISSFGTYHAKDNRELAAVINEEVSQILRNGGIFVQLDPTEIIDVKKLNAEGRIFVPMHMITYISTIISLMTSMPKAVDTGIVNPSGDPVVEYEDENGNRIKPS
jgi:hypothetical protein